MTSTQRVFALLELLESILQYIPERDSDGSAREEGEGKGVRLEKRGNETWEQRAGGGRMMWDLRIVDMG